MAFETTNKSDNTGGKLRLDISNINQSALKGENANTDEELLQIIIDNIAMKSTPVNSEVSQTLEIKQYLEYQKHLSTMLVLRIMRLVFQIL